MTTVASSNAADRAHRREIERRHRVRRQAKLETMRETLATLERALPVILTLEEDGNDVQWDGFLDARALRVRELMQHTLQLTREARQLHASSAQLHKLLSEHRLASRVVTEQLQKHRVDEWGFDVHRWQRLAMQHFDPWTMSACMAEIHAARTEMANYQWSTDKQGSDLSVFGWRDRRRFNRQQGVVQFRFKKTFRGCDIARYAQSMWGVYTDPDTYQTVVAGPRVRGHHQILQRLGPDMMIVHGALRFPESPVDAHIVFIAFRAKTEHGFYQYIRAIDSPELKRVFAGPTNMWFSHSASYHWRPLNNGEFGYTMDTAGSFGGSDVNFVDGWMQMVLECTLRGEIAGTGRQLLTCTGD